LKLLRKDKVSGVIFDTDGTVLAAIQIRENETDNGRSSDIDGAFRFTTTKDTCLLIISYIGYKTQTAKN